MLEQHPVGYAIAADNPASNALGGFKEGSTAHWGWRQCMATPDEISTKVWSTTSDTNFHDVWIIVCTIIHDFTCTWYCSGYVYVNGSSVRMTCNWELWKTTSSSALYWKTLTHADNSRVRHQSQDFSDGSQVLQPMQWCPTEWYVCPVHDTCTIAFMGMLVQFFVYSFTNVAIGVHTTSIGWTFGTRWRWTLAEFDAPPAHCWLPSSTKDYSWWSWLLTASHWWASQYVQDLVSRSNHSSEVSLHGPYAKAH